MSMSEDKQERLDAITRMRSNVYRLRSIKEETWREINDGKMSGAMDRILKPNGFKRMQELQQLIVNATQAEREADEIERFIDRAVQTYVRDYPQFGRGVLK